jgi:hypothetical protein
MSSDLSLCIRTAVPNPTKDFNMRYIEVVKSLDMGESACDQRVIRAAHEIYKAMGGTQVSIKAYMIAIINSPDSLEFLTRDETIELFKGKIPLVKSITHNGYGPLDPDSLAFIGFATGASAQAAKDSAKTLPVVIRQ